MSTDPTPTSLSGYSLTNEATSSFDIISLWGAIQADMSDLEALAASIDLIVISTGSSSVGTAVLFHRLRESKIGSWLCLRVGCCAHASTITLTSLFAQFHNTAARRSAQHPLYCLRIHLRASFCAFSSWDGVIRFARMSLFSAASSDITPPDDAAPHSPSMMRRY